MGSRERIYKKEVSGEEYNEKMEMRRSELDFFSDADLIYRGDG